MPPSPDRVYIFGLWGIRPAFVDLWRTQYKSQAIGGSVATDGGPNFAYDLCVQKISREELVGIDLGSWQLAFNGAEPINPLTLQRFSEAFTEWGFQRRALYPCYGLAEATLLATGGTKQTLPKVAAFDKAALASGTNL